MRYICQICGYVYDEAVEGVLFKDLPATWACPECGAPKDLFSPEDTKEEPTKAKENVDELVEVDPLYFAALCTNLARGCEKQYNEEGQKLYLELADYFLKHAKKDVVEEENDLLKLLEDDLASGYPNLTKTAKANSDRGTLRICTWGEKVTRMLDTLLKRYLKEGPSFLDGKKIFVCSACGFTYVGDTPPNICPVCKVPSWKFMEVGGAL